MVGDRRDFSLVTAATLFQALVGFVYSVVIRRYVPPDDYGVYQAANLFGTYLSFVQLGVLNSYSRDYPQYLGERNVAAASRLRGVALLYLLVLYTLVSVITSLVVLGSLSVGLTDPRLAGSLVLVSLFTQLSSIYILTLVTIRSEGRFGVSAGIVALSVTTQAIVGIACTAQFGYWGMFAGLLSGASVALIATRGAFPSTKLGFDFRYVVGMIRSGLPLLVASLVWTVLRTIDQFAIVTFFSVGDLGVYSVAITAFAALAVVPQALAGVMYVKMSSSFGSDKSRLRLIEGTISQSRVLAAVLAVPAVIAYFALPPLVELVMPEYVEGIAAGQIAVVGVTFYSSTILYGSVLTILRMNADLLRATGLLCLLSVSATMTAGFLPGRSLERIAFATAVAYCLYSLILAKLIGSMADGLRIRYMIWANWGPGVCALIPCILIYHNVANPIISASMALSITCASSWFFLRRRGVVLAGPVREP